MNVIGGSSFLDCISLSQITFGGNLLSIERFAFLNCRSLTSVHLPDSLIATGRSAFENCVSVTTVTIGPNLATMDYYTFRGCLDLEEILVHPDNSFFSSWNGALFTKDQSELLLYPPAKNEANISLPPNTTVIGFGAFRDCLNFTSFALPEGITTLDSSIFANCSNLTEIHLPDSIRTIESGTFSQTASLISINTSPQHPDFNTVDGILFSKDLSSLVAYASGKTETHYQIPNEVTLVEPRAFADADHLQSIGFHEELAEIGHNAFQSCDNLTEITIPDSVMKIGSSCFEDCLSLVKATLGNGLSEISSECFENCISLTDIQIGSNIASIGSESFYGCSALTRISFPNVVTYGYRALWNCDRLRHIEFLGNVPTSVGFSSLLPNTPERNLARVYLPAHTTPYSRETLGSVMITRLPEVFVRDQTVYVNPTSPNLENFTLRYSSDLETWTPIQNPIITGRFFTIDPATLELDGKKAFFQTILTIP